MEEEKAFCCCAKAAVVVDVAYIIVGLDRGLVAFNN